MTPQVLNGHKLFVCQLFMFHKLYSLVLKPVCCLCDTNGLEGLDLCHCCHTSLPHNHFYCHRCAAPFVNDALAVTQSASASSLELSVCGACLAQPSAVDHAIIPFLYRPPVDFMIKRLKFSEQLKYSRILGDLLADAVANYYDTLQVSGGFPDVILPVPSHRQRLAQRGFNQAEQIATTVACRFNTRCNTSALERTASGLSQSSLSAAQRETNIRRSFEITHSDEITGRHVAIVDDVYTTGATAKAVAGKLKTAGAEQVSVWAVARTP